MTMRTGLGIRSSSENSPRRIAALACAMLLFMCGAPQANQTTDYEYDALGRLVKVTRNDGGEIDYVYDAAGNRETVTAVAGSNPPGDNQQNVVIIVIVTTYLLL